MPLRLAYVTSTRLEGEEPSLAFCTRAARGFVDAGTDIELVLRRGGGADGRETLERRTGVQLPSVSALRVPRIGGSKLPFYCLAYRHIRGGDRNAVLFRNVKFLPWAVRLRRRGLRVFFEAHDYWGDAETRGEPVNRSRRRGIRTAQRWLPGVDAVFCTSARQAELYRRRFPELSVELALTGTRYPRPNERNGFSRTLGYFGSLDAQYPIETVLEGLAVASTEDVRLLVVGVRRPEERARIERAAARHGLADRVEIHDWVPPTEVERFRDRVDAGLIPLSRAFKMRTNTPLKLLDYLSASLPTIATRAEVVSAYVTHGRETLLVGDSATDWAAAIDRLYADFEAYRAMAVHAEARAREFTWTRRAEKMVERMRREFG